MHNRVLILLNEREANKKRSADQLAKAFTLQGITTFRIEPSIKTENEIISLKPDLIITDYILEDYGTGLDLLYLINDENKFLIKPNIIFYTDETSINVAVEAMKMGATDYLKINAPDSIHNCIKCASEILAKRYKSARALKNLSKNSIIKKTVLESPVSKEILLQLKLAIKQKNQVVILCGTSGSGKTQLAQKAVADEHGFLQIIDTKFCQEAINKTVNRHLATTETIKKQIQPYYMLLKNVNSNSEEVINLINEDIAEIFQQNNQQLTLPIFITTRCTKIAEAVSKNLKLQIINIPSLSPDRKLDIAPLIQLYLTEYKNTTNNNSSILTNTEIMTWLTNQSWPGEITQVIDFCSLLSVGLDYIQGESDFEKIKSLYSISIKNITTTHPKFDITKDPFIIFESLIRNNGNLNLCAIELGVSIREIIYTPLSIDFSSSS